MAIIVQVGQRPQGRISPRRSRSGSTTTGRGAAQPTFSEFLPETWERGQAQFSVATLIAARASLKSSGAKLRLPSRCD